MIVGDEKGQRVINTDDCWLYAGYKEQQGYGQIHAKVDNKWVRFRAHRVSYENFVGQIPDGLVIDHLCRVRHCINPEHLEPVTDIENTKRGEVGRNSREKTHCINGHEFNDVNIYWLKRPNGNLWRVCKACRKKETYERRHGKGTYEQYLATPTTNQ